MFPNGGERASEQPISDSDSIEPERKGEDSLLEKWKRAAIKISSKDRSEEVTRERYNSHSDNVQLIINQTLETMSNPAYGTPIVVPPQFQIYECVCPVRGDARN